MKLQSSLCESYKAGRQAGEDESRDIQRKKKIEAPRNPSLIDTNGKNTLELNCSGSKLPAYGMAENSHQHWKKSEILAGCLFCLESLLNIHQMASF